MDTSSEPGLYDLLLRDLEQQCDSLGDEGTSPRLHESPTCSPSLPHAVFCPGYCVGTNTQATAKSRRGRKRHLKVPDLQAQLDALTQQFDSLSNENDFLRHKLKAGIVFLKCLCMC